jgi:hypothetical protein
MVGLKDAVLSSLKHYSDEHDGTHVINRKDFLREERANIELATGTIGKTPGRSTSRKLKELRDDGILVSLDPGQDLLLDSPIDVEREDLPDVAIDHALRANLLHIGIVPIDTQQTLVRQQKGQARLLELTIENYAACCAVCDIADRDLLVASHIIGWAAAPEHRGDLGNVICLCRIHDALFWAGHWSLDDSLRVLKRQAHPSRTMRLLLEDMTVFRVPLSHLPSRDFVRFHRQRSGF